MYDPGTAKPWRERVWTHLLPFRPASPLDEALRLDLFFEFERPVSHFGKKGLRASAPREHMSRPDVDNLTKAVMDEMSELGFWRDDDRVVSLAVSKAWAREAGRFGCLIALSRLSP